MVTIVICVRTAPPGGGAKTRCLCGGIIAPDRMVPHKNIGSCVRTAQKARWQCFDKTFSKVFRAPAAKRRSRVATRETSYRHFLFAKLFLLCLLQAKEKAE